MKYITQQGYFFFLRKKVNMLLHFLIVQALTTWSCSFMSFKTTSYMCNKWPSKIMNVFKHSFDLCSWLTIIPRENEVEYLQICPSHLPPHTSLSCKILFSQLYFVTDVHSVWSLSNKETEETPNFLSYCNLRLSGV